MGFHNAVSPQQVTAPDRPVQETDPCQAPRQCRDVIFLLLFLGFIGGLGFVTWRGATYGNPARIIYGTDSWGNVCNQRNRAIDGVSPEKTGLDLRNKRYLFHFRDDLMSVSTTAEINSVRICVLKCPSKTITTVDEMRDFSNTTGSRLCVYDVKTSGYFDGDASGRSDCPHLPIKPHEAVLHHCVPKSFTKTVGHVFDALHSLFDVIDENFLEKCASDVRGTWREMLLLSGLAFVVALLLTLLIQCLASVIIWAVVVGVVIGTIAATGICWYHYYKVRMTYTEAEAEDKTPKLKKSVTDWLIGSIVISIITVIILLVLLAVRKHISLVVQLFKEAGKAIRKMPLLLLQPIVTIFFLSGSLLLMGYIFLYIETAGQPVVNKDTGFVSYKTDQNLKYMKWYHIVGIIWIAQFVMACHKLTVAGAISSWYFTRDKKSLSFPVIKSAARIVRYHLGSAALGSLILTLVYLVRMTLTFIENRLRGRSHPVAVFLLKCFQCCLWCFEKFIKFLNSNAYIEIAIHGYGFCKAARQAFQVIVNNALHIVAINSVGDFVLFLGKVATIAIVCVTGIQLLSSRADVHYVWLPVTLVAIFAYFISTSFMSVYEMAIDTIFLCFCEDSIMNNGEDKPYYMSVGLMRCMSARVKGSRINKVDPAS